MLPLTIKEQDLFRNDTQEFVHINETTIQLEHSLVSISKWEAKWHKAFLSDDDKTAEEMVDYLRWMTLTKNVDPNVYYGISSSQIQQVRDYISDPMTATTFTENQNKGKTKKKITNEIIYYQMIQLGIPMECQKWHLNRLLTLIRVCAIKSQPDKKMKPGDTARRYADLNKARRAAMHTKG